MAALRLPLGLPGIDPGLGLLGTTLGGIRTRTRTRRTTLPRIDPLLRIRGVGRGVAGTTGGSGGLGGGGSLLLGRRLGLLLLLTTEDTAEGTLVLNLLLSRLGGGRSLGSGGRSLGGGGCSLGSGGRGSTSGLPRIDPLLSISSVGSGVAGTGGGSGGSLSGGGSLLGGSGGGLGRLLLLTTEGEESTTLFSLGLFPRLDLLLLLGLGGRLLRVGGSLDLSLLGLRGGLFVSLLLLVRGDLVGEILLLLGGSLGGILLCLLGGSLLLLPGLLERGFSSRMG